jgi:sugar phosphate isomerase/epimerase
MGLICHMPTFTSLADLSATIREASVHDTLRSMEMAKELGAQKITLHPPYLQGLGKFVPDLVAGLSEKSLAVIHEQARELEIMVCVENMAPGSFAMGTPGQFREMLEAFPQFALTLDIGHTNLGPGSAARKAIDFIQEFPHKLGHIHVSDNFGKQDNHLPIGAGTIDYESVMKALVSSGYDESITLEIFSKDKEYLVTSRRKIQEMVGII